MTRTIDELLRVVVVIFEKPPGIARFVETFVNNINFHYNQRNSFHLYKEHLFVQKRIFPGIFRYRILRGKYEKNSIVNQNFA